MAEQVSHRTYIYAQTYVGFVPVSRLRPFDTAQLKEPQNGFAYLYGQRRPVTIAAVDGIRHALRLTLVGAQKTKPIDAAGLRLDAADVQIQLPFPLARRHIVVRQDVAA